MSVNFEKDDAELSVHLRNVPNLATRASDMATTPPWIEVANTHSDAGISFLAEDADGAVLNIGWRLHLGSTFVVEGRLFHAPRALGPGQSIVETITLPDNLPSGRYSLQVLLVRERKYWFLAHENCSPLVFDVAVRSTAPLGLSDALTQFQAVFEAHPTLKSIVETVDRNKFRALFKTIVDRHAFSEGVFHARSRISALFSGMQSKSDLAGDNIVSHLYHRHCAGSQESGDRWSPKQVVGAMLALHRELAAQRCDLEFVFAPEMLSAFHKPLFDREGVPSTVTPAWAEISASFPEDLFPYVDRFDALAWRLSEHARRYGHRTPYLLPLDVFDHLSDATSLWSGEYTSKYYNLWIDTHGLRARYDDTLAGAMLCNLELALSNVTDLFSSVFLTDTMLKNWAQQIPELGVSYFEFIAWFCFADDGPIGEADIARFSTTYLKNKTGRVNRWLPADRAALDEPVSPDNERPSVKLIGLLRSVSGLGQNARMIKSGLGDHVKLSTLDMESPPGDEDPPAAQDADVALYAVNAEYVPSVVLRNARMGVIGAKQIGFFLWELENLAPEQHLAVAMMDEIWTPSDFVRQVFAQHHDHILNIRKGLSVPDPAVLPTGLGLDDAFTFLVAYDANSGVERKNPLAAVKAFQQAFPNEPGVRLVVKSGGLQAPSWGDPHGQIGAIQALADDDPRIRLVAELLPEAAFFGLIASVDCVVSMHRSEGFGYLPAYGLMYEKPVIATNYSGPTDFCTEDTAFLVPYEMKSASREEIFLNTPAPRWADPDIEACAQAMVDVFNDREAAQRKAVAGRTFMQTHYHPDPFGARLLDRLRSV
ncbi:MAG: hypothetical protein ACFB2Z_04080 [Maricaulaceae bacterium]